MTRNEQLPKLKNEIKSHTDYELSYIKSHIEEKKKRRGAHSWSAHPSTAESAEKKERTITDFCKKERLKIILKLCSENKTKNEEYLTSLNYLLQNLKKMIKWESSDMKRREEELSEIQQLNSRTEQAEKERE
ncbi:unnamed protein product [Sphagnum jensenii]